MDETLAAIILMLCHLSVVALDGCRRILPSIWKLNITLNLKAARILNTFRTQFAEYTPISGSTIDRSISY